MPRERAGRLRAYSGLLRFPLVSLLPQPARKPVQPRNLVAPKRLDRFAKQAGVVAVSEDAGERGARALEDQLEHESFGRSNFDVWPRAADLLERALQQQRNEALAIVLVGTTLRAIEQHDD